MKKYGIFYATSAGKTAAVAHEIAKALDVAEEDVLNVKSTAPSRLADYEVCLLGAPTYGAGDLQGDMADFIDGAKSLYLKDKKLAFFGTGNQGMSKTFCSAVGVMAREMSDTEATQIGQYDATGYVFESSAAEIAPGVYAGLLLDSANHKELIAPRIAGWTAKIAEEA